MLVPVEGHTKRMLLKGQSGELWRQAIIIVGFSLLVKRPGMLQPLLQLLRRKKHHSSISLNSSLSMGGGKVLKTYFL
jgi:hypothetical protein